MLYSISIHALLAESDAKILSVETATVFLSTLSLRRATTYTRNQIINKQISIHALLAESDIASKFFGFVVDQISIHALLAESDILAPFNGMTVEISIHALLAESDLSGELAQRCGVISIHALLAESDSEYEYERDSKTGISIHALLAESDDSFLGVILVKLVFLSTLSLRRATHERRFLRHSHDISIHALLAESDMFTRRLRQCQQNFYPRSPCGERPLTSTR